MGTHGRNRRQRTRIGIGCIAVILAVGACGGDDDDEASDADGAAAADDSSADTGGGAGDDGGDESGDSSDERESPYEVDPVDPVDQGVGTVTIDGTTYELLDVGESDDDRDGVCGKAPVADQLDVIMNHVDADGAPVPKEGEELFNVFFADLPYNSTFSPNVEFQVDDARFTSSAPDFPTEVAWGFSPDGLHAEGTATLYDANDDDRAVEATFSITCPEA